MGYRQCKACERRFLSSDGSDYCSQSCFETVQARVGAHGAHVKPLIITIVVFTLLAGLLAWDVDTTILLFRHSPVGTESFANRLASGEEEGQLGLARAMADGDPEIVAAGTRALLAIPRGAAARAKASVLETLRIHYALFDDELKTLAITFFGRFGHRRTDVLVLQALQRESLRLAAVIALGERRSVEGLDPILDLLKSHRDDGSTSPVLEAAIVAAGQIQDDDFRSVPLLCRFSKADKEQELRRIAVRALADVYTRNVRQSGRWTGKATGLSIRRVSLGIRFLRRLVEDEDPKVRESAEAALRVTKGSRDFGARYEVLEIFDR